MILIFDLINVYREGSITEDLFQVCIEISLNDYKNYKVLANCILPSDEYDIAINKLYNVLQEDIAPLIYNTSVYLPGTFEEHEISLVITQKMIDAAKVDHKEDTENGNDNSKNE